MALRKHKQLAATLTATLAATGAAAAVVGGMLLPPASAGTLGPRAAPAARTRTTCWTATTTPRRSVR